MDYWLDAFSISGTRFSAWLPSRTIGCKAVERAWHPPQKCRRKHLGIILAFRAVGPSLVSSDLSQKCWVVHGTTVSHSLHGLCIGYSHEHALLPNLVVGYSCFISFPFEQESSHFGRPLSQRLAGLFPGRIVTDFEPESCLFIFSQESSVDFTNGSDNRAGYSRLVILASLEISAPVHVDEITESSVALVIGDQKMG